jgi:hypothetical protein
MIDGKTHKTTGPAARIGTSQYPHAFVFSLRGALENALLDKKPDFIEIGMTPNTDKILEDAKLQTAGLHQCIHYFAAPVFIGFFERYNEWLKENYGTNGVNWHPTLNFCRIIRNAAAHGRVRIDNVKTAPVTWRGLSIGPADDGKSIIGSDLRLGDMIGLMFEADDELTAIGAPVL